MENGRVKLPPEAAVPDRTRVYVIVPDVEAVPALFVPSPHLANPEQIKDFEKRIVDDITNAGV